MNEAISNKFEQIAHTCKGIGDHLDGCLKMGTICSGMGTAEMVASLFCEVWNDRAFLAPAPIQAGVIR